MASAKLNPGPNEHSSGNTTMLTHGNLVRTRAVSFSRRSRLSPNGKSTCNAAIENNDMVNSRTKNEKTLVQLRRLWNGVSNVGFRHIIDGAVIQPPSRNRGRNSAQSQQHQRRE